MARPPKPRASGVRIATWNINSIRPRIALINRFVEAYDPDVLCLQEIKVANEHFPLAAIAKLGFPHIATHGQKNYHGVAILSRLALEDVTTRQWCGIDDTRHNYATLPGGVELHNFYVPSGGDIPDPAANDRFAHKLKFMTEMAAWFGAQKTAKKNLILVGDLNVAPLKTDVGSHRQLLKVVSHTPVEVEHLARVRASQDWIDAVRHFIPDSEKLYSWWSYRARDWAASDRGRRLDHVWVTRGLEPALQSARIVREARGWDKASDHVPVLIDLAL